MSPNPMYRAGAHFETRVRRYLKGKGWVVIRSAGSRGAVDLVAARGGEIVLLQCRVGGEFSLPQRLGLYAIASEFEGRGILTWRSGREIMWHEVDAQGHLTETEL